LNTKLPRNKTKALLIAVTLCACGTTKVLASDTFAACTDGANWAAPFYWNGIGSAYSHSTGVSAAPGVPTQSGCFYNIENTMTAGDGYGIVDILATAAGDGTTVVYAVDVSLPNSNVSTDIIMSLMSTNCTIGPSTNGPASACTAFQSAKSASPNWARICYLTNNVGVTQPHIEFRYVSGSSSLRSYADVIRFSRINVPCLNAGACAIQGPVSTNVSYVTVTGVTNASDSAVRVYQKVGNNAPTLIGSLSSGIVANAPNLVPVTWDATSVGAQVAATQTVPGGQESCPGWPGYVVGGGPNPGIRVFLDCRTSPNGVNNGPVGAGSDSSAPGLFFMPGTAGATTPGGGILVQPSTNWQTIVIDPRTVSKSSIWSGTDLGNALAAADHVDHWCGLEGIDFQMDNTTDTGPFDILIDNIYSGPDKLTDFDAYANGQSVVFANPSAAGFPVGQFAGPNSALVAASPFALSGTMVDEIQFQFSGGTTNNWVRMLMNNGGWAFPQIHMDAPLQFDILLMPRGQSAGYGVGTAPPIADQTAGNLFTVAVSVTPPINTATGAPLPRSYSYQWQFNGTPIAGATGSSYSKNPLAGSDAGTYSVIVTDQSGNTLTRSMMLTVIIPAAPGFSGLAASPSAYAGSAVTLSGTVSAAGPIYPALGETITVTINGNAQTTTINDLTGDFSLIYNLAAIPPSADPYSVAYVYGGDRYFLAATNTSTTLTVNPAPLYPAIFSQPQSVTNLAGTAAMFSVGVVGSAPLACQWQFYGTNLSDNGRVIGSQSNLLTITSVQAGDIGNYQVVVTNSYGSATSAVATLSLFDNAQLISVSVPAGTPVLPGTVFTQTWTMQNIGASTWSPGFSGYTLNVVGKDSLGAVPFSAKDYKSYVVSTPVGSGSSVAPGAQATFSLSFIAPQTPGTYTDTFQLSSANSVSFGPPVSVQVVVSLPGIIGQYDRARAVSYANNYAGYVASDGYFWTSGSTYSYYGAGTPVPTDLTGDDCAHFVSSCIGSEPNQVGGGLYIASRVPPTYGEPGAQRLLYTSLVANGLATEVASLSSMSPGDVIGWNWEGDSNPANIDHATIYLGNGLLAAHAASCLDVSATTWYQGFYGGCVCHLIHILDAPKKPQILAQPANQAVLPGASASFTVLATGVAPLSYQWLFNGSALQGDTSATLLLPAVATTDSGGYSVVVTNAYGAITSAVATLTVNLPLYATNLVVVRVGNGTEPLSGATGNSFYLDQYTSSGAYVSTITVPDETTGSATSGSSSSPFGSLALLLPGAANDSAYAGALTLSGNGQYLNLAAYCEAYPFSGADVTVGATGGAYWRGIYAINASGYSALAYTNSGLYSGGNHTIRSVVSSDGLMNFWVTGQAGSPAVKYVNATNTVYNNGSGIPSITASTTGPRVAQLIAGNLTFSDWTGASGAGLYACSGAPTPAANAGNTASSQVLATGSGSHPNDFAASPDRATIYIADDRPFVNASTAAGGIQRWDTATPPTGYTFSYTLPPTAGTSGAFGLAVDFSAHSAWGPGVKGAVVYATTAGGSANSLVQVVDSGAAASPTTLATASANEALRGLRFGPGIPPAIATQPQSQTNTFGTPVAFSVTATGSAPFSYQWLFNGTRLTDSARISGSASSLLTLANVLMSDAGNYQVIVTNTCGSATSAVAVLSVLKATPVLTWTSPAPINYGTALTSVQLNATATAGGNTVSGTFGYGPTNGAMLSAGTNTLTVTFTPTDTSSYTVATTNVSLVVVPAPLTVTANDATRQYGQANPLFTGTLFGLANNDPITATYGCTATADCPPGTYSIVPSLADPNNRLGNYTVTTNNGTLTVLSATTVLTWTNPAAITYGTALSSDQLNATATAGGGTVPGVFGYAPTNGAVLSAGTNTLTVTFTPTDTTSYTVATTNVSLVVLPAPLTVTANDATRQYGQTNPVFTGTLLGLTNDDTITATYGCTATADCPPGTYSIVPSLADPNNQLGNYTVTTNSGTLTVLAVTPPPTPALQAFALDATTLGLSWNAAAGTNYQLQYKTDLAQTNWFNLGSPITAAGDTVTATDSTTNSARYYRVLLVP
jgi:Ig-like domain from next to BRCA1 gene/MBG domain (YGX type)/Immunoglobulin I-set domain/Immunoglobulin domain